MASETTTLRSVATSTHRLSSMATPAIQTEAPTGFHYFPKLPAELRLMVWGHAFPCRMINIFAYTHETQSDDKLRINVKRRKMDIEPKSEFRQNHIFARPYQTAFSAVGFEAGSSLPIGHIHRISTDVEPLDRYTDIDIELSSGRNEACFDKDDCSSTSFTKINLERDILCFRALGFQRRDIRSGAKDLGVGQCLEVILGCADKEVLASIRHLAITFKEMDIWTQKRHGGTGRRQDAALNYFPNLTTLYIMCEEFKTVHFSEEGKRIPRGQEAKEASKKRKAECVEEIPGILKGFVEYFPQWNRPKVVVVQNGKALRKIVERSQ